MKADGKNNADYFVILVSLTLIHLAILQIPQKKKTAKSIP